MSPLPEEMDKYLPSSSWPGRKQTTLCLLLAAGSLQAALPTLRNIGEARASEDGGLEGAHYLLRAWEDFTYPGEDVVEGEWKLAARLANGLELEEEELEWEKDEERVAGSARLHLQGGGGGPRP